MPPGPFNHLSRREREVLDLIYSLGEATATEIQERLGPETQNAGTRKILAGLLRKKSIRRRREGKKYVYVPSKPRASAATQALRQVVDVFYSGSFAQGLMGLLEAGGEKFTDAEVRELKRLFDKK